MRSHFAMKRAILPFLFLVGLLVLVGLGGFYFMSPKLDSLFASPRVLKVAFPANHPVSHYEPTRISIDYEYIFLENIYSPLVELDSKGTIVPGIAERVFWQNDELHLQIRPDLKTNAGEPITIDDVIFSLKRLLILSGNTHGNFKDLVCNGVEITTIEQECPGIRKSGETLILRAEERKSFLLPMLAAIDFAIIPQKSVNKNTLAIEDYSSTTGPYFVAQDDGRGNIELRRNPKHYHATPDMAEIIKFVPFTGTEAKASLRALESGEVDLLTTVDIARADELISFVKDHPSFGIHVTQKIRSHLLVFTAKGIKKFSPKERRYIGQKIRLAFSEIYANTAGFEARLEFFPSLSEGGLNAEQQLKVIDLSQDEGTAPNKKIKLGLIRRGGIDPWANIIKKYLPEALCYFEDNAPDLKQNLTPESTPDAFIVSTDTGFMEDISLISYSLNAGLLGMSKAERRAWLADYMAINEKSERLEKLRELHLKALIGPWIVPLMASPYAAIARKPWKIELSDLYANNQLWLIKTK